MNKNSQVVNVIFFTLQIAASIVLLWAIFQAAFLPELYKVIIGGGVILLAVFSTFLLLKRVAKKFTAILRVFYVFVLALTVGAVGIMIPLTDKRVKGMVRDQPNEGDLLIDVVVLKGKTINDKSDLLNGTMAVQTTLDQENQEYAITFINSDLNGEVKIANYDGFEDAIAALYAGEVDFLLINETYITIMNEELDDIYEELDEELEIVYQVKRIIAFDNVVSDANVTEKPFNILVIGQNQRKNKVSDRTNTDVILLVTINPKTKQVLLTSLPRDSFVPVPYSSMKDKLTHAGIYGATMTVKTVQNYMGVKIDFFIRVNYISLINLVNAVGGITVDNPSTFKAVYPKYKYKFEKGKVELNGAAALAYVRERKKLKDGDMGRNEHQRIVLEALVKKVSSPSMLINFNKIMQGVSGNYLTNVTTEQIYSIVKMQLADLASWNILQQGLDGSTGGDYVASLYSYKKPPEQNNKYSVVYIYAGDLKKAKANIAAVTQGKILTKEDVKLPSHK